MLGVSLVRPNLQRWHRLMASTDANDNCPVLSNVGGSTTSGSSASAVLCTGLHANDWPVTCTSRTL